MTDAEILALRDHITLGSSEDEDWLNFARAIQGRLSRAMAQRLDVAANDARNDGYHESAECYTTARNLVLIQGSVQ